MAPNVQVHRAKAVSGHQRGGPHLPTISQAAGDLKPDFQKHTYPSWLQAHKGVSRWGLFQISLPKLANRAGETPGVRDKGQANRESRQK